MSRACKVCGVTKPDTAFRKMRNRHGECLRKICAQCQDGGGKTATRASSLTLREVADRLETTAPPVLSVSVPASYGFEAAVVDDDRIEIKQPNQSRPEDPDVVSLTRAEASRLFAEFGPWAGAAA